MWDSPGLVCLLDRRIGIGQIDPGRRNFYKAAKRALGSQEGRPGEHAAIRGMDHIEDVVLVDQRAIGRTPRANALTYTKALDPIRQLLADTRSKAGYEPGIFPLTWPAGDVKPAKAKASKRWKCSFFRCIHPCPDCNGKRFKTDVLNVHYRGQNIHDILTMTVDQALAFFKDHNKIVRRCSLWRMWDWAISV